MAYTLERYKAGGGTVLDTFGEMSPLEVLRDEAVSDPNGCVYVLCFYTSDYDITPQHIGIDGVLYKLVRAEEEGEVE
jgi:hypothetical protein